MALVKGVAGPTIAPETVPAPGLEDTGQGPLLWSFEAGLNVEAVAITPDGSRVAAVSAANVYLLDGGGR